MSNIFSIIPARGGSKGVPGKNIKLLNGIPLIAFSIKVSLDSDNISRTIVSTDSKEIANIARKFGAEVPFLRPSAISGDNSTDFEFFIHAIEWFQNNEGKIPDYFVHLRPTTPLREPEVIDKAINYFINNPQASALRSMHEMSESAYKCFEIENNMLKTVGTGSFELDHANNARQEFPPTYYANGYVDIIRSKYVLKYKQIHGNKVLAFVTNPVNEVDTIEDFEILEFQISKLTQNRFFNMSGYLFNRTPQKVLSINTKHRKICSSIPCPGTEEILRDLDLFESRSMLGQLPLVWDHAVDYNIFDSHGNKWIDFTSTIFVTNVGHSNKHVVSSIKKILDQNLFHSYAFATKIRSEYIKKLVQLSPSQFEKAFLLSAGTEATEAALKLMRMNAIKVGKKKPGIICFEGNWHGRTMGAQMMGGNQKQKKWIGYLDPNIYHMPFPYPWSLKHKTGEEFFWDSIKQLEETGVNMETDIAGFMIETFQGWGAVFYPKDYIQALDRFAKKRNIVISFDEMQSGFARTGKMYGYEHYEIKADLLCLGKGISNGAPLSAVISSAEIMDLPEMGEMSSTHSANPISCAAGLATLEEIKNKNLISEAERKGNLFFIALNDIKDKFPDRISYILGKGMVAAILFNKPGANEPDSLFASKVSELAMQKGLLVVHTGRESIKLAPPLTIPDEALIEGVKVLQEAICEIIISS